ncbi:MAG: hypothetical protein LRZ84_09475 [Desertifilum sp.]|nr:hypothetical protein [Desertifilum sp.]
MWRKLKNLFLNCRTYADLSPDLATRHSINCWLRSRRSLSFSEWHECWWQPKAVSDRVSRFVYDSLKRYSGLQLACVRPSDRLEEDLCLSLVCWYDWNIRLCEDFWQCFGIDLTWELNLQAISTLEDLVLFLDRQLLAATDLPLEPQIK